LLGKTPYGISVLTGLAYPRLRTLPLFEHIIAKNQSESSFSFMLFAIRDHCSPSLFTILHSLFSPSQLSTLLGGLTVLLWHIHTPGFMMVTLFDRENEVADIRTEAL
jgi:hypothetical protein